MSDYNENKNRATAHNETDDLAYLAFSNANGSTEPPSELDRAALPGIVGEIIGKILPHTEASEAALLVSLLAAFGSIAGRKSYTHAGQSKVYPNLGIVLVGETSKGRKGTSLSAITPILESLDEEWYKNCNGSGLSTGEGLIYLIRDERTEKKPVRQDGRIVCYQDEIVDQGVPDKRIFVVEEEFASVLKRMSRPENSLSAIIRDALDGNDLRNSIKNSPDKATSPHATILGHITKYEAVELMTNNDCRNGFANRFLWVFTNRSKMLSRGGPIPLDSLAGEIEYLKEVLTMLESRNGELPMSDEAWELWDSVYPILSADRHGLFGAVTGRAEAHVKRLCFQYSLIQGESTQSRASLEAALALWRYCEATANWMFGTPFNNPDADKLHRCLLQRPEGMTKTEISFEVFGNHCKNYRVANALEILEKAGAVIPKKEKTDGADKVIWLPVFAC